MKIFTSYTTYPLGGENTIKGANKTKVKSIYSRIAHDMCHFYVGLYL